MYKYITLLLLLACNGTKNINTLQYVDLNYGKGDSAVMAEISNVVATDNGYELTLSVIENAPGVQGTYLTENQEIEALLYNNNLSRIEANKEIKIASKLKEGTKLLTTLRINQRTNKYEIFDIEI